MAYTINQIANILLHYRMLLPLIILVQVSGFNQQGVTYTFANS
jgi:hypothetical protein